MDIKNRLITLISAWLLIFAAYASVLCVSPILNIITQELNLTASQAGLLFSAPVITLALVAFLGGFLGDRIGPRKTAGIGAILLSLSAFLRGVAPNFAILFILNLLVGVGWGFVFPNLPKIIKLWFPNKIVGTATGIYSTGVFAGSTLALATTMPLIFPIFGNWRGVYFFWGTLAMIIAVLWWIMAREPCSPESSEPFSKQALKVSFIAVLKNKYIWIIAIFFALAANVTFYIVTGWFPAFFIQKGFSAGSSGFLTSVVTFAGIPAVFLVPFISDRVGLRKPFLWISSLIAAGAFLAVIFTPFILDIVLMVVLGITLTATYVMSLFLPLELVNPSHAGTASGVVISIGYIGGALGPLIAGYLKDVTGTLTSTIILLAVLMVISMALVFLMPETGIRKKAP
jgi:MFS transporter, CP family, cyanate transporter